MKTTIISSVDKKGGAAIISWILKKELKKIGYSSFSFVGDKITQEDDVQVVKRNLFIRFISKVFPTETLYRSDWILKNKEYRESDLVHCHNIHGSFFSLNTLYKISKEKPVVWTLHDEWSITPHCAFTFEGANMKNGFYQCPNKNIYPRILWHNENFLMKQKEKIYKNSKLNIVVPCLWLKNKVEKSILKNQNIKLIYYGINTNLFLPKNKLECRKELQLPLDKKIIFFLADGGKNNPFKGWKYTKDVIEKLKDDENILFICAGNDDSQNIQHKNVVFLGKIDQEVLSMYYSACDLLLYSSIADNFPLIILEAMSCGLPIVSFDTGGIREALVHKINGYIAKYRDSEDLITGIKYIFNLAESEISEMSENSSVKIKREFNLEKMVNEYKKLYDELTKK